MSLSVPHYSLLDYYRLSIEAGVRSLAGPHQREALARILNPLSYPRYMEYQLALNPILPLDGLRVLDIGSPKLPALLLARNARCEFYSTDIRDYFIKPTAYFLRRLGLGHRVGRDLHLEVQDGRQLTYSDGFFDRVFSISVVEHIPEDGDTQAIQEIARVLRDDGIATLTVPFCARGYHEEFVKGPVYERSEQQGATFYQRHYDLSALQKRLIEPSGLHLLRITPFGEPGFRFETYWNRVSMRWKLPLLWAQPLLAKLFLRELRDTQLDAACGVAIMLQKPAGSRQAAA